ncbi:hypothetical protein JXA32_15230 [Candidatus Sumerlaeota bacterium]|nr:hypothetical protein [Candidatus Sumerlaeota bacterium]
MGRYRSYIIIGVICIVALITWRSCRGWPITNWPREIRTIVAYGDSITRGYGGKREKDYPTQLGERLGRKIINRGFDGARVASGLERLEPDCLARQPDMVLLCLGGNDLLDKRPRSDVEPVLRSIIERLQQNQVVVVLIEVEGPLGFGYGDMYKTLAREYGCIYVPNILKGVLGRPKLMHDQIHPNTAGYFQVALKVKDVIEPYLN